ncbi:MAG: hypothetical protein EOO77_05365 [Oxalobacteraceae bacterium]|nr:MAG: hypothetical protein EOO77_05365 [Oxalobacteraceae bacterium]
MSHWPLGIPFIDLVPEDARTLYVIVLGNFCLKALHSVLGWVSVRTTNTWDDQAHRAIGYILRLLEWAMAMRTPREVKKIVKGTGE